MRQSGRHQGRVRVETVPHRASSRRRRAAAVLAVVTATGFATVGVDQAGAVVERISTAGQASTPTPWSTVVTLAGPDASLGVLSEVRLELTARLTGTSKAERLGDLGDITITEAITLTVAADVTVDLPGTTDVVFNLGADEVVDLGSPDGVIDYDGPGGVTVDGFAASMTQQVVLTDRSALDSFVSNGSSGLAAAAVDRSRASGDLIDSQFTSRVALEIQATYRYLSAGMTVTKTPESQVVVRGGTASFAVRVENDGEVPLTGVQVDDPAAPGCSRTTPADLAVGGVLEATCTVNGVDATFTNRVTATGTAPDARTVSDSAEAVVEVATPGIELSIDPATQRVVAGDPVTFTVTVRNVGMVDLTDVVVSDPLVPACERTFPFVLASDGPVSYTCTLSSVTSPLRNTMTVTGQSDGGQVSASATSDVLVISAALPGVSVRTMVNGLDATLAPGVPVTFGEPVTFTFHVTNTGSEELRDLRVAHDVAGAAVTCPSTELVVGASMTCEATMNAPVGDVLHDLTTVTGVGATTGRSVTATADSFLYGIPAVPCRANEVLVGVRFLVNGAATEVEDLRALDLHGGDTVTMRWSGVQPGSGACEVSLAAYQAAGSTFDPGRDQTLTTSVSCVPGSVDATRRCPVDGLSVVVPAGPFQIDAVTGRPLGIVGPGGGYYSAVMTGGPDRLISAANGG